MKRKNLTLAMATFVLAISGAFAHLLAPVPVYIRVNTATANPCKNCGVTCDHPGSQNCTVTVLDTRIGQFVTRQGYKVGCIEPLTHTNATPQPCTTTIP